MKVSITGASNFVNRMFEACGSYQWAREFLRNSIEADATQVEFGIEWQAVSKLGVYRRMIADNGIGMSSEDLLKFFSTLGEGAKKIGGVHENFGVGAKIASLPWNPEGVVVVSYKDGRASLIWIMLDPDSGDYELVEFEIDGEKSCVIDPSESGPIEEIDWSKIKPDWLTEHGTVIVLLGSEEYPDTVLGNPHAEERTIKGLSIYLNTRFWDLTKVDVKVVELRSEKKSQWPQGIDDGDNSRRPNNRRIQGARYYLDEIQGKEGALEKKGRVELDEGRVTAEWYLWRGKRPTVHTYAREGGYVAVRYKDELFELTYSKPHFRWFGIIEGKVQQLLTIILEPPLFHANDGRWGVHPDQSRNRLIFSGNGEKGIAPPLADWGAEFAEHLPDEILAAIRAARGDLTGSLDDDEYRKRLQDRFGNRWTVKGLVRTKGTSLIMEEASSTNDEVPTPSELEIVDSQQNGGIRRRRRKTLKIIRPRMTPNGGERGVERDIPVDVPKYRYASGSSFDQPWHLATWAPQDPDGPTVVLNLESPILEEVIAYHQAQYADIYAEEVSVVVRQVFGEVAACKIAHSQKLAKHVPTEELDRDYRSEKALTVALMGLMAEESLIAQRVGRFGRKKAPALAT
jgi:hypothetical protein